MRGDLATARLHREWLRGLPARTGKSLTKIAEDTGLARSTLTRPLKEGDQGTSTLHASTIEKVVQATGVAPPAGSVARPQPAFSEEASPYNFGNPGDPLRATLKAMIGDRNGIDPWTLKTRALELAGYLPGDIVLVDLNASPRPGDAVCAQVYDWSSMKAETVMRVFERAPPVEVLVARSMDPAFAAPIVVDGERVVVKGVLLPHRLRAAA